MLKFKVIFLWLVLAMAMTPLAFIILPFTILVISLGALAAMTRKRYYYSG